MTESKKSFESTNHPEEELSFIIPVIIGCILLSIPVRIVVRQLNLHVSQNAFLLVIGIFIGAIFTTIDGMNSWKDIMNLNPDMCFHIYIPIFIASTVIRVHHYTYLRSLPQVLTSVILGTLISSVALGSILSYILHKEWNLTHGILVALVTIPIHPLPAILHLRDMTKHRILGTMLEAESVMLLMPVCGLFDILLGIQGKYVISWKQVLFISLRQVGGGCSVGVIIGRFVVTLLKWLYNDPANVVVTTLGMNYFVYFLCEKLLGCSGPIAIIILNCFIMLSSHRFTDDVIASLKYFWGYLNYTAEVGMLMVCTVTLTIYIINNLQIQDIYGTILIYFAGLLLRLLRFLVLSPLLNLMTYELNIKCLLVLGWCDIKGCININLLLKLLRATNGMKEDYTKRCMMELLMYCFLSIFVNTGLVRVIVRSLGFMEMSSMRKHNMNNCMGFIMEKRTELMKILKQNRFFALGNWHRVKEDTFLPDPYQKLKRTQYEEIKKARDESIWIDGKKCPACVVDFAVDTTEEDLVILLKETDFNILKAKKISMVKQYENGVINKYSLEVLIHYLDIMFESSKENQMLSVNRFLNKNKVLMFLRKALAKFYAHKPYQQSQSNCGTFCFYVTMHICYDSVLLVVTIIYAVVSIAVESEESRENIHTMHVLITMLFLCDLIFKLIGLSVVWLVISGIMPYFKRKRNIVDFFLLLMMLFNLRLATLSNIYDWWYYYVIPPLRLLAVIRLVQLPSKLIFVCPYLIKCIDSKIDTSLCWDYDLAIAVLNSADEILDSLPTLIELKIIRDLYRKSINAEKTILMQKMAIVQKERPWIAITVRTKQAIRTTLTALEDSLNEYKVTGVIDNIEYTFIYDEIFIKQKILRGIKFIQTTSPKTIFKEVIWMSDDESVVDSLLQKAHLIKLEPDEVIVKHGRHYLGIYIVVAGVLRLKYKPPKDFVTSPLGCIPIVDNLNTTRFDTAFEDDLVVGNTLGELCMLTNRPSDCRIHAVSSSSVYFLSAEVIKNAMLSDNNPINGLASRMWKSSVIHLAIAILMEFPLHVSYTTQQIKLHLERAFVPNLCGRNVFNVTDMMDNVVLIEGVVADYTTQELFVAPLLIPRTLQKLSLSETIQTRLLIIPNADAQEADFIKQLEDTAEEGEVISKKSYKSGKEIFSTPSDSGAHYNTKQHLDIVKMDEESQSNSADEDYAVTYSYLKKNRSLRKYNDSNQDELI